MSATPFFILHQTTPKDQRRDKTAGRDEGTWRTPFVLLVLLIVNVFLKIMIQNYSAS